MIRLRIARATDGPAIVALRDHLARWQIERGIDQWHPYELDARRISHQAAGGQWHILTARDLHDEAEPDRIVATARVLSTDAHTWGPVRGADGKAGYLHGLMVHRDYAGRGLGSAVLSWFERYVVRGGRSVARLDCVANNEALRHYYLRHGYTESGYQDFGGTGQWSPVRLFEKEISLDQVS